MSFRRGRHRGRYEPLPFVNSSGTVILHIPQRHWHWSKSLQIAVFSQSTVVVEPTGAVHEFPSLWRRR